jgi:hypothetical protein
MRAISLSRNGGLVPQSEFVGGQVAVICQRLWLRVVCIQEYQLDIRRPVDFCK